MNSIDLTMTATRRPELVATTLASFSTNLFERLPVRTFFLNLDPVWGSTEDDAEVERIARSFFSDVRVRRPETPSYGGAVKWLWSQPQTEWFLHLEDDWILSHRLNLRRLERQMAGPGVVQIKIANWSRLRRRRKPPMLGLCPLFARRDVAALASTLINPDLDPDKQFRSDTNEALRNAMSSYRAVYFGGVLTPETAIDIGRDWRDSRGIQKAIVDGASVWSKP